MVLQQTLHLQPHSHHLLHQHKLLTLETQKRKFIVDDGQVSTRKKMGGVLNLLGRIDRFCDVMDSMNTSPK